MDKKMFFKPDRRKEHGRRWGKIPEKGLIKYGSLCHGPFSLFCKFTAPEPHMSHVTLIWDFLTTGWAKWLLGWQNGSKARSVIPLPGSLEQPLCTMSPSLWHPQHTHHRATSSRRRRASLPWCYMHSKELVLLSPAPTCRHRSIIQADINLTNESFVSEVWSLERDVLGILDTDLIINNAKGTSVTTSLRMNTKFLICSGFVFLSQGGASYLGLIGNIAGKERLISYTRRNTKLSCLPPIGFDLYWCLLTIMWTK